jgi:predicted negative regulator of RcsB-dependent stress response
MAVITPAEAVAEVDVDLLVTSLEHNARISDTAGNAAYRNGDTKAAIDAWKAAAHYRRQARAARGEE